MSNTNDNLAMKRITGLVDPNSFVEIGGEVRARSTDFNLSGADTPSDGVVTGHGLIDGNLVFVYSQDSSVLGGSIGEMHAKKIAAIYEMALKMGAPVIGILDSAGLRLQESVDALEAFSLLYAKISDASGVVPQIAIVAGNCGGGMAVIPALSDFAFMTEDSKVFVSAPNTIKGNFESKCDTSSAEFQSAETGVFDAVGAFEEIVKKVRTLVSILPSNNTQATFVGECQDDLNRSSAAAAGHQEDPAEILKAVSDNGLFMETLAGYTEDIVTGFIALNGMTVGVVACAGEEENLSAKGAEKASEMVNFCDCFEIPLLTVTNVTGYKSCKCTEKRIAKALAKLTFAFANATVPRVNLITGKAYGSAYSVFNTKSLGADLVYAWPDAAVGMMDAKIAVDIMFADSDAATKRQKVAEYESKQNSVKTAAARGYVDRIVSPADTRKYLIDAFEMLLTKNTDIPYKKHGAK